MAVGLQAVVFALGETLCALDRAAVRRILPVPHLWRPPAAPRTLAGFLDRAGKPVAVLALARLLGLDCEAGPVRPALYHHIILTEQARGGLPLALLVDRVLDVIALPAGAVSPVASAESLNGCVIGTFERAERLVHLVSQERLLLEEERQGLADLAERAAERQAEWASIS